MLQYRCSSKPARSLVVEQALIGLPTHAAGVCCKGLAPHLQLQTLTLGRMSPAFRGEQGEAGCPGSVHNTSGAACLGLSEPLLMVHVASTWKAEMTKCCHFCVCVSVFLLLSFRPVCLILNEIPFMATWFLLVSTFRWVRHHECCFICSSLIPVSINSFFCYSFIHFRM